MAKSIQNNSQILPDETIEEETIEKEDFNFAPYRNEIILILTLVLSIFSLLSILGLGGIIGRLFRTFLFGTMGIVGYLFPFVLFFSVVFILSNYKNRRVLYKIICCIGIYFILMGLLQLAFYAQSEEVTLLTSYFICAQSTLGGGFFGALLSMPLSSVMGIAGAYVILAAIFLILFTFVTSRFLLSALGYNGKKKIQKMHRQYQAEKIEKTVIKESYGKLPPRKRKPAVTFDLMKEEEILPAKKEETSYTPPQKEKKQKEKKVEMQEYQPVVDETSPISQNSSEIRKDLEQFLEPLESSIIEETMETIPSKPFIRFVDNDKRNDYVRKEVESDESTEHIENIKSIEHIEHIEQTKEAAIPLKKTEIQRVKEEEPSLNFSKPEPVIQNLEEPEEMIPAFASNHFEHFTKEKKFDGSVLEGTKEETLKADVYTDYANTYVFPPMNLLAMPKNAKNGMSAAEIQATTERLQQTFESFKVPVTFGNVSCGPAVTRYEIQPNKGVKVSKITNLSDDIKLNLAAADIRIEAPIPGKAAIGIEVPNRETTPVMLRELLENSDFQNHKSNIAFAVGKDVGGQPIVTDIAKMPHLLIAGATGSGKSVCINTLIISLLYKANPDDVKLIMIDPKVVELNIYNGIPHLLIPVVTDPKGASAALKWAVDEMNNRYDKFADLSVRDLSGYNKKMAQARAVASAEEAEKYKNLPQIVIIVDELADLMMAAPSEVEDSILHLSQMARAAGLHLVIATQRPSVNVITGVIKANVPSRIAFSVSSAVDSRTILDGVGAEKLLGKGDMLFFPSGLPKPIRVQGAFVSDTEVGHVVEFLQQQSKTSYDTDVSDKIAAAVSSGESALETSSDRDDYFIEAGKFIIEKDKASIGMLQRVYKIGFNRAARIMDQLADAGVVGSEEGTKPRKILMTMEEFEQYLEEYL